MTEVKRATGFVIATRTLLVATLIAMSTANGALAEDSPINPRVIWSDTPVVMTEHARQNWRREKRIREENIYPIGNGRLGATVFGAPRMERLQFHEDSLWVGNEENTGGYQPFGDGYVKMSHVEFSEYRRELDISRAVQTMRYKSGGVRYTREFFASHPAQVVIARFRADKPASLSGKVTLGNLHESPITSGGEELVMKGDSSKFWWWKSQTENQETLLTGRKYASDKLITLEFEARVRVVNEGGTVRMVNNGLVFAKCDALTIFLAADTNYLNQRGKGWRGPHPHERVCKQLGAAPQRPYAELPAEHFIPLAGWIDSIREVRKEETRRVMGINRGWLMRSENNIFGGSTWQLQKGDPSWLCQNLRDHYAFTRDRDYLRRYAYPVMRETSEFRIGHLKELPDGTLVAPDGYSPEHGPEKCDGVSYEQQLCWDLMTNVIEASEELGVDAVWREFLKTKRAKLLGPKIAKWVKSRSGGFQRCMKKWPRPIAEQDRPTRRLRILFGGVSTPGWTAAT